MIALVGLNHKTAPLSVRERIFAGCQEQVNLLDDLRAMEGVLEVMYLSTCNRVEVVAAAEDAPQAMKAFKSFLAGQWRFDKG